MNKLKKNELGLIRSRILALLVAGLVSFLALAPLTLIASGKGKTKSGNIYMHPLNKDYHAIVTIANFDEGKFNLTIESENGVNVYYDEMLESPEKFAKIFDFSKLEDGEYNLIVKNKKVVKTRRFTITDGQIKVHYYNKPEPVFRKMGDRALFVLPNQANENYSIKVISPNGEELFQTFESNDTIKKMFDFSQVESGLYQLLVYSDNAKFAFDFKN